jgi:hypothetical protein
LYNIFMPTPENPFDKTIWDPNDPEHAIEDPMHGPSTVHDLLNIPAMPLGDGTYYQPGGYYAFGTPYIDPKGRPVHRFSTAHGLDFMRDTGELSEWTETARKGPEALTQLEASRQKERLEKQGYAFAFREEDACAGGKNVSDCVTASTMLKEAREYTEQDSGIGADIKEPTWVVPAQLSRRCGECALSCDIAIKYESGEATDEFRFTNTKPFEDHPLWVGSFSLFDS